VAKRKGKSVSFDAMIKFFLQYHGIATKKDIDRVMDRLDRLERTIRQAGLSEKSAGGPSRRIRTRVSKSAADTVLGVVQSSRRALGFADIREKTGFDDKKLRNIIFRLNKFGKIRRVSRGMYMAV
jgi:hypothetical protein